MINYPWRNLFDISSFIPRQRVFCVWLKALSNNFLKQQHPHDMAPLNLINDLNHYRLKLSIDKFQLVHYSYTY